MDKPGARLLFFVWAAVTFSSIYFRLLYIAMNSCSISWIDLLLAMMMVSGITIAERFSRTPRVLKLSYLVY